MPEDPRAGKPSASAYAILEQCPGQPAFVQTLPPDSNSAAENDEWAERGSRIHKALELRNTSGLQDDGEIDDYNASLKYEQAMFEQWRLDHNIAVENIKGPFQETRLWMHHPATMAPMLSGQLDIYWIAEPYALALDRKTGFNPRLPVAEQSGQLRVQAVLLWREFDVTQIRIGHIKQKFRSTPRDYSDYLLTDLQYAEQSILYHLWEAEQPEAPLRPGSHCNWCPAKPFCKQAAAYSMLPSVIAGDALPAKGKERDASIATLVSQLQPADLVKLWSRKLIIEKVLAAVVARLKGLDNDTLKNLGLSLGKPRTTRKVNNTLAAFNALKAYGCTEEELWNVLELPLGKAVEMLQGEKHQFTKDHGTAFIREFLKQYISESVSDSPLEYL